MERAGRRHRRGERAALRRGTEKVGEQSLKAVIEGGHCASVSGRAGTAVSVLLFPAPQRRAGSHSRASLTRSARLHGGPPSLLGAVSVLYALLGAFWAGGAAGGCPVVLPLGERLDMRIAADHLGRHLGSIPVSSRPWRTQRGSLGLLPHTDCSQELCGRAGCCSGMGTLRAMPSEHSKRHGCL